ncbi:hypothetical protein BU14_0818s0001 [Porphyra umbilicalis]|uniref:Secreted protein n=1 Tax=Porphyra umbilicalis TaxID=2786 RepID=A0A1X6NNX1_PORUM|nr:hypothetical protein BU14_0818s0001 [Porphyra umbilicalis]|eukprot:OSX70272.1 hypothetical protein BU14_0818s0001 [Porphyra umbilicalis]
MGLVLFSLIVFFWCVAAVAAVQWSCSGSRWVLSLLRVVNLEVRLVVHRCCLRPALLEGLLLHHPLVDKSIRRAAFRVQQPPVTAPPSCTARTLEGWRFAAANDDVRPLQTRQMQTQSRFARSVPRQRSHATRMQLTAASV